MTKTTTELTEKSLQGSAWVAVTCPDTFNILLAKRSKEANNPGQWNLFGGGIEGHETALDTALRELWEEAGIRVPASSLRKFGSTSGNMTIYLLDLTRQQAKSVLSLNKLEIAKAKWFSLDSLPTNRHKSTNALLALLQGEELFHDERVVPSMRRVMDMVENIVENDLEDIAF